MFVATPLWLCVVGDNLKSLLVSFAAQALQRMADVVFSVLEVCWLEVDHTVRPLYNAHMTNGMPAVVAGLWRDELPNG